MKLLLALVVIGVAVYFITQRAPSPLARSSAERDASSGTVERPRSAPRTMEGDLTAEKLRDDLAKAGDVVREKARAAGEKLDDARIVATIKSKLALDRDLSASAIDVSCVDGRVTLSGTVTSDLLAERAAELARTTEGVVAVDSRLGPAGR